MSKINANNVNLYYESYGSGQPLVFVTGFSGDHTGFDGIVEYFSDKYQVILFDNRGCGQSDAPDMPYTIDMMADDASALCQALQLDRCNFFGVSMGGAIVQTLAHRHPQLVRKAILCNTFTKIDIRFALAAKARLEFMQLGGSNEALLQSVIGWCVSSAFLSSPNGLEKIMEVAQANPYPMTEVGYRNQLPALLNFDSQSWLHSIRAPCLVIGSDQDMIVSEQHMRDMAAIIPNASYCGFAGAGHVPFWEQPEQVCHAVLEFLSKE